MIIYSHKRGSFVLQKIFASYRSKHSSNCCAGISQTQLTSCNWAIGIPVSVIYKCVKRLIRPLPKNHSCRSPETIWIGSVNIFLTNDAFCDLKLAFKVSLYLYKNCLITKKYSFFVIFSNFSNQEESSKIVVKVVGKL